jgi:hypothetical protein
LLQLLLAAKLTQVAQNLPQKEAVFPATAEVSCLALNIEAPLHCQCRDGIDMMWNINKTLLAKGQWV